MQVSRAMSNGGLKIEEVSDLAERLFPRHGACVRRAAASVAAAAGVVAATGMASAPAGQLGSAGTT